MNEPDYEPSAHYDRVTEAWGLLLGDELHWGVFGDETESLPSATAELTRLMIEASQLTPGLRVLDVGCGSGAPARRLASEHGATVLGITTSAVGVETAQRQTAQAEVDGVTFEQRDGTATGLPDASFDRVWVLESSHLMPDRGALIEECARVLRPGGRVALCDIIRRREIPFTEIRRQREQLAVLRSAFGAARMDPLDTYAELMTSAGLVVDRSIDLTTETLPTLDRWRSTADEHRERVVGLIGESGYDAFTESLDILEAFWTDGTLGYGLIAAAKPA